MKQELGCQGYDFRRQQPGKQSREWSVAAHPEMYATIGEGARERLSMIAQWALDHDVMTYHPWDDWPEERDKQRIRIAKCIADVKGGDINDLMACADATRQ